jgi:hypothetical protein
MRTFYSLIADAILIVHGLIVLFNAGALPLIWIGYFRKWSLVRNFCFRMVHLLLIAYIAAATVLGAICPLTTWENQLRIKAGLDPRYQGGYIAHWLHKLLFYDFDEKVFIIGYVSFLALVLLTLIVIRPHAPRWWPHRI